MTARIVHLAVYDTLADWEAGHALAHIRCEAWQREPGRYEVVTVAETAEPVTTAGGVRILPDLTFDRIDPADSALLILPGAGTWNAEGGNAAFARAARRFLEAGVPVAAICGATFGLAREGLLNDRAHTSGANACLAAAPGYTGAAHYRDERAVTDGDLITAGPTAPVEFAREILARLDVYEPRVLDAWYRLFGRQDASAYWELAGAQ